MVIWTALWEQMNTDEQHTSSHCGSPLWPSRLWRDQLEQDQMSGQVLCGRVDSYRYYLDLQSIPSLLSCEAQKMVIFIPFLSAALYSCNFLSWSWFSPYLEACADTSHPPPLNSLLWAPSNLLEAPSILLTRPYSGHQPLAQQWHSRAGLQLFKASPTWPHVLWTWSTTSPCPSLSPTLGGGVQCPGLELGREDDETQWSISSWEPCPGMRDTRRLETASTTLQIMPDQFNWLL